MSTNHNLFEEKGEPKRYRTEVLPLTSLTPYLQVKPAEKDHQRVAIVHIAHRPESLHLPPSSPAFPPALISCIVSVHVKDHLYLLTPCLLTYIVFTYLHRVYLLTPCLLTYTVFTYSHHVYLHHVYLLTLCLLTHTVFTYLHCVYLLTPCLLTYTMFTYTVFTYSHHVLSLIHI